MIFAVGRMVQAAMQASIELMGKGLSVGVVDARFVKPMDEKLLLEQARKVELAVTLEENVLTGGFGEGVLRLLEENACSCRRAGACRCQIVLCPTRPSPSRPRNAVWIPTASTRSILARWAERKAGAMKKRRADETLFEQMNLEAIELARALIMEGRVMAGDRKIAARQ